MTSATDRRVVAPPQEPLSRELALTMLALDQALHPFLELHRRSPKIDAVREAAAEMRQAIGRYSLVDKLYGRRTFEAPPLEVLRTLLIAARQAGVRWDEIVSAVHSLQDEALT